MTDSSPIDPRHRSEGGAFDVERPGIPRATAILLALGGAAVAAFGLAAIAGILTPVLLALILTICVHPVRVWLERKGLPRGLATGSVIVVVFGLLAGFIGLFIYSLSSFATLLPEFAEELAGVGQSIAAFLESIGWGAEQVQVVAASFDPEALVNFIGGLVGGVTGLVGWLVIVLTMLILMAMDASYLPTLLRHTHTRRPALIDALVGFSHNVRRYMVVTTGLGVAQGAFNAVALTILGVPGALLWGMLSFLCSFIPNIGYFIAIIPPLVFGGLVGGWPTVVWVIIIYGVINAIVQSIVQPRIVGQAVLLNQSLTFFSVLFWTVIFGAIGAILAVPLTLFARTILVDADPNISTIWRPLTGDTKDAETELKAQDVARKAARKARHEEREWHEE